MKFDLQKLNTCQTDSISFLSEDCRVIGLEDGVAEAHQQFIGSIQQFIDSIQQYIGSIKDFIQQQHEEKKFIYLYLQRLTIETILQCLIIQILLSQSNLN